MEPCVVPRTRVVRLFREKEGELYGWFVGAGERRRFPYILQAYKESDCNGDIAQAFYSLCSQSIYRNYLFFKMRLESSDFMNLTRLYVLFPRCLCQLTRQDLLTALHGLILEFHDSLSYSSNITVGTSIVVRPTSPFKGMKGRVIRIDSTREQVVVALFLLGRTLELRLPWRSVERV